MDLTQEGHTERFRAGDYEAVQEEIDEYVQDFKQRVVESHERYGGCTQYNRDRREYPSAVRN